MKNEKEGGVDETVHEGHVKSYLVRHRLFGLVNQSIYISIYESIN